MEINFDSRLNLCRKIKYWKRNIRHRANWKISIRTSLFVLPFLSPRLSILNVFQRTISPTKLRCRVISAAKRGKGLRKPRAYLSADLWIAGRRGRVELKQREVASDNWGRPRTTAERWRTPMRIYLTGIRNRNDGRWEGRVIPVTSIMEDGSSSGPIELEFRCFLEY